MITWLLIGQVYLPAVRDFIMAPMSMGPEEAGMEAVVAVMLSSALWPEVTVLVAPTVMAAAPPLMPRRVVRPFRIAVKEPLTGL